MSFWAGLVGVALVAAFALGNAGWGFAVVGVILLWISISRFWTRYKAASNALLAKHTFEQLPDSDKQAVLDEVARIMTSGARYPSRDPHSELARASPPERFGFCALGMANLGIPPKIGKGWYEVRNPYAQIIGAHREIATVRRQLRSKYGVDIDLSNSASAQVDKSPIAKTPSSQPSVSRASDTGFIEPRHPNIVDAKPSRFFEIGDFTVVLVENPPVLSRDSAPREPIIATLSAMSPQKQLLEYTVQVCVRNRPPTIAVWQLDGKYRVLDAFSDEWKDLGKFTDFALREIRTELGLEHLPVAERFIKPEPRA